MPTKAAKTPKKRILIVDDDAHLRELLKKTVTNLGHEVTCSENGKHAQQVMGLGEIDLMISDIQMPEMNGMQLLHWSKQTYPKIPVILMTGFSEIAEAHEAAAIGADQFLPKPFKKEELVETIAKCFPTEEVKEEPLESIEEEFSKISMNDFVSGQKMQFDIYIRVNEGKYLKIAHTGEKIEPDRIEAYRKKNLKFLYMKKEDLKTYLNFNLTLSKALKGARNIDQKKKVNFVKHTTEVLIQNLYNNEMNKEDFIQAQALVENSIAILTDDPQATDLLSALAEHSDFLYAHSVGVSLFAALIGKAMKWNSTATLFKLSVGGLLHDIGKKDIPREVLEKPQKELSPQAIAMVASHPKKGYEALSLVKSIPSDILEIVLQHHENCLGNGYPTGLTKNKIHPLARVIAVANDFCTLTIKNPTTQILEHRMAIQHMLTANGKQYDEVAIQGLQQLFR